MINRKNLEVYRNKTYIDKIRTIKRVYPDLTTDHVDFILSTFGIDFIEVKEYDELMLYIKRGLTCNEITRVMKRSIAWVNSTIKASPTLRDAYNNQMSSNGAKGKRSYTTPGSTLERLKRVESLGYEVDYKTKTIPTKIFYELSVEKLLELGISKSEIAKRKPAKTNNFSLERLRELLILGVPRFDIREELGVSDSTIENYRKMLGIPSKSEKEEIITNMADELQFPNNSKMVEIEKITHRRRVKISKEAYLRLEVMTAKKNGVGISNISKLLNITEKEVLDILAKEKTESAEDVVDLIKKNNMNVAVASATYGISVEDIFKYLYSNPDSGFLPVDLKQKYKGYLRMVQIHQLFKEDGLSIGDIANKLDTTYSVVKTQIRKAFPHPALTMMSVYNEEYDFANWGSLNLALLDTDMDPEQVAKITGIDIKTILPARAFINKLDNMDIGKYVKYHYVYQNKLNGGI